MNDNPKQLKVAAQLLGAAIAVAGPILIFVISHSSQGGPYELTSPHRAPILFAWLALALSYLRITYLRQRSRLAVLLVLTVIAYALIILLLSSDSLLFQITLLLLVLSLTTSLLAELKRSAGYVLSAFSCLVCLVVIAVCEVPYVWEMGNQNQIAGWGDKISFRYLFPNTAPYLGPGGRLMPNQKILVRRPDWYLKTVRLVTNSEGFRNSHEILDMADSGVLRILNLGDSFLIGFGVGQNDFFGHILEKLLNEAVRDTKYEVVNAEVSNLVRGALYLQEFGFRKKPEIALYGYYPGNDLVQDYVDGCLAESRFQVFESGQIAENSRYISEAAGRQYVVLIGKYLLFPTVGESRKLEFSKLVPKNYPLVYELGLFRTIFSIFEKTSKLIWRLNGEQVFSWAVDFEKSVAAKSAFEAGLSLMLFLKNEPPELSLVYSCFERSLRAFNAICEAHNIKPVLLYIPTRLEVQDRDWVTTLGAWNLDEKIFDRAIPQQKVREICRRIGVDYLDLTPRMRKHTSDEQLYLWQDLHWNERAHFITAEETASFLKSALD